MCRNLHYRANIAWRRLHIIHFYLTSLLRDFNETLVNVDIYFFHSVIYHNYRPCYICDSNLPYTFFELIKFVNMASPSIDESVQKLSIDVLQELRVENKELLKSINVIIHEAVNKEFTKLLDRLDEQQGRIHDLEITQQQQASTIAQLRATVDVQCDTIQNLQNSVSDLEQYSRRNCLQIFGVPENSGECTDDIVCDIANAHLKVPLSKADIDRSHRTGYPASESVQQTSGNNTSSHHPPKKRPRPIVVKFVSYRQRQSVISQRRKLKGSGIVIQEQLTKSNQRLLKDTLKSKKVVTAWSSDGRIIASVKATNGRTVNRAIRNVADLESL